MGFRELWRCRGAWRGEAQLLGTGLLGPAQGRCREEGRAQLRRIEGGRQLARS